MVDHLLMQNGRPFTQNFPRMSNSNNTNTSNQGEKKSFSKDGWLRWVLLVKRSQI